MSDDPPPISSDVDELRLVTLCRMRIMEAELARAKLEAEGIPCFIRDANTAIANPFLVSDVPLLVRDVDFSRAKAALARPTSDDAEGEYVDETYRCPRCHRRDIELMPLSRGWRQVRAVCVTLVVLPIVWAMMRALLGESVSKDAIDLVVEYSILPLILIAVVLGASVLLARRDKRCKSCGHEWHGDKP